MTNERGEGAKPGEAVSPAFDESTETCLGLFVDALRALSATPRETVEAYGNSPAAAWELKQDLVDSVALLEWRELPEETRNDIAVVIAAARSLPFEASAGSSGAELNHPAWGHLRARGKELLAKIDGDPSWRVSRNGSISIRQTD